MYRLKNDQQHTIAEVFWSTHNPASISTTSPQTFAPALVSCADTNFKKNRHIFFCQFNFRIRHQRQMQNPFLIQISSSGKQICLAALAYH